MVSCCKNADFFLMFVVFRFCVFVFAVVLQIADWVSAVIRDPRQSVENTDDKDQ